MLNLASLCFPDQEKSCFYCCPPIRDPEADPLDNIEERQLLLRDNCKNLQKNLANPHEISGEKCWGLGYLDDREGQAGCLLHPLRHNGRDLRHLTGYHFKCANALCREARVFADLSETEQKFCLSLCRDMDSFHYSSRRNPLMRLLAWEKAMVQIIINDNQENESPLQATKKIAEFKKSSDTAQDCTDFIEKYQFLWLNLDFRLDAYLLLRLTERKGFNFIRNNLDDYIHLRDDLITELRENPTLKTTSATSSIPAHKLEITLSLSRLLKFGANLWELPCGCEKEILQIIDGRLSVFMLNKELHNTNIIP